MTLLILLLIAVLLLDPLSVISWTNCVNKVVFKEKRSPDTQKAAYEPTHTSGLFIDLQWGWSCVSLAGVFMSTICRLQPCSGEKLQGEVYQKINPSFRSISFTWGSCVELSIWRAPGPLHFTCSSLYCKRLVFYCSSVLASGCFSVFLCLTVSTVFSPQWRVTAFRESSATAKGVVFSFCIFSYCCSL